MKTLKLLKLFILTALLLSFGGGMTGCLKNDDEQLGEIPEIKLSEKTLNFTTAPTEPKTFHIELTGAGSWSVEALNVDADAVEIHPSAGTASADVSVLPGPVGTPRQIELHVTLYGEIVGRKVMVATEKVFVNQTVDGSDLQIVTVYSNNFDKETAVNNGGWPKITSDLDIYKNEEGTGAANVVYDFSGTMSVRTSNAESTSGKNVIFFGGGTQYFTIGNIAVPSNNLNLKFEVSRAPESSTGSTDKYVPVVASEFTITLSADGKNWSAPLNYAPASTASWITVAKDFSLPAGTETLYIKFTSTVGSVYRLDDVILTTGIGGDNITFDGGSGEDPEAPADEASIADIFSKGAGNYEVKGAVVTAVSSVSILLEDAKDSSQMILAYIGSDYKEDLKVGDVVNISGAVSEYPDGQKGRRLQFSSPTYEKTGESKAAERTAKEVDGKFFDEFVAKEKIENVEYIKFDGVLTVSGNYLNVAVDGTKVKGSLYVSSAVKETLENNSNITVTGYATYASSNGAYLNVMATDVVKTGMVEEKELQHTVMSAAEFTCTETVSGAYSLSASSGNTTVNGKEASGVKLGTGSKGATFTSDMVKVAGDATLSFYGFSYTAVGKATLTIAVVGEGSVEPSTVTIQNGASGVAGNPPFTITGATDERDYFTVKLTGLTANSKISFTTSDAEPRVVLAGINLTGGTAAEPEPEPETPSGPGLTPEEPMTVAQAIAKANEAGATATEEEYYVKGKIASIKYTFSAQYGTATFDMIDEGAPDAKFTAYSVRYLDNQKWVEGNDQVTVGDEVIVCGKLMTYNGTPETASGSGYLYQFVSKGDSGSTEPETPAPGDGNSVTFSEMGYANAEEVVSVKFGDITLTFDKGTNNNSSKYYDSGAAVRAYGGNTLTFDAGSKMITGVKFTFGASDGSNEITADKGSYTDGLWSGSASNVVFTIGGTTGNRRIAAVEVTMEGGGTTTPTEASVITFGLDEIKTDNASFPSNAYGSQSVSDESTWAAWTVNGVTFKGARICEATSGHYVGSIQMQGNASDATKQGFFGNTTGKKITKIVVETLNDTYSPTFNIYLSNKDAMPNASNAEKTINAGDCSDAGVASNDTKLYTTTVNVTGDYTYFALRNDKAGANYVKSITVTFE